jgi:hypothetical protein
VPLQQTQQLLHASIEVFARLATKSKRLLPAPREHNAIDVNPVTGKGYDS